MPKLTITFEEQKQSRRANWLVKQFARLKGLVVPETVQAEMDLYKQRGLGMRHRSSTGTVFFPTDAAWDSFLEFIDVLHKAQPFALKATYNDVYQAYSSAFADMILARLLPDTYDDLSDYLPQSFLDSIDKHGEVSFFKLAGISIDPGTFIHIGQIWIGTFGNLSFDSVEEDPNNHKKQTIEALNAIFEKNTPVVTGGRIQATEERSKREDGLRCEIGLSILCVLLNMTYENAFSRLWSVRRIKRPEEGLAKQLSFGLSDGYSTKGARQLTLSTQFSEQTFEINIDMVERWQQSMLLANLNQIAAKHPSVRTELEAKLLNATLYFRQASLQSIPEMQLSTLWICVESVFTGQSERVLEANLPGLLAITIWSLRKEFWPRRAETLEQLKSTFTKHYQSRSRTFHHGKTGHVSARDVQQFSIVVSNLILSVAQLVASGHTTSDSVLTSSKSFLQQIWETNQ